MFKDNRGLVKDVVSLRSQLRLTEKNLQSLGEQLSQSGNNIIAEDKDRSGADWFPGCLTLEDLHKPNTGGYPHLDRTTEQRACAHISTCDCRPVRDMETEMSVLRRKVYSIRQENTSLVMENKQLISDLEAAQLELSSSTSKIHVLGSTVGARISNVPLMKEQILGLERELDTQSRALEYAEQKLEASEQTVMLSNRLVEKLRDELRVVKAELEERTRLGKRAEQQRNQALQNAEMLTLTFKDYKEDVSEKLRKVMESEDQLKVSLMECDREREELERKCAEQEREKESLCQNICELKEVYSRSECLSTERVQLLSQVQQLSDHLKQLQKDLTEREARLQEVARLRRENEDLRLLTACQEQRVAQANREREQDRAELTSLESILDLLHLRENRDGALCVNPCLLPSQFTSTIEHKSGERYQKLLPVLQMAEREKSRQASAAHGLQERLTRAQEEISSLQTSITERSSHYQQLHNQLLNKAAQATSFEKELKKKSSRVVVLEKQLQEKSAAYSQAAIKTNQLEQELLEKARSIQHYQSVLNKKQREYHQTIKKSKIAQSHKCKEMEDRIEVLQLSLVQKQTEIEELEQHVSDIDAEKLESQQRAAFLQTTIDQLTEDFKAKSEHSEETHRNIVEQAAESASKVRSLQKELSSCKEELCCHLQQMEEVKKYHGKQLELKNCELSELQEELRRKCVAFQCSSEENLQLQDSIENQHTMLQDSTSRIAQLEESQSQLQSQVSQLEQELEKERTSLSQALRRREREVEEATQEVQKKERQAVELSDSITQLSSEMSKCRVELSDMELELLHLRRDISTKASQLSQMEDTLKETKGLLDKKSEMVIDLEEKLHRSDLDRRNLLQRTQLLEGQLQEVRGELSDTLDHLQELRDMLKQTQLTSDQQQAAIDKLAAELRENQRELEEKNHEVLDLDTALKERQGELQQRAQLLGQLDVAIKEHKLEMDKKVEYLQEALEKSQKELREKDEQMQFLTKRLEMVQSQQQDGEEGLKKGAVEHGQQLRAYREQLQKTVKELQEAHTHCNTLTRQIEEVSLQARQKECEVHQLQEEMAAMEKRSSQAEVRRQATVNDLQQQLDQQRKEHHKELSALQQTRGQLLKVSDQISSSLRNSQEQLTQRLQQAHDQLEEARATSACLHGELRSKEQLLQCANENLLIKESEITRLLAKLSSFERATEIQNITLCHKPHTPAHRSPPLKDTILQSSLPPSHKTSSACSSLSSWHNTFSDTSLELSDSLKASVQAALLPPPSPDQAWQGLTTSEVTSTTDMSFNPLTYMLDQEEPEESDLDTLSGMLRFVNHTLALQEQQSFCNTSTQKQEMND
ncbi:LOW QUALITY PROTEIN: coiled-coil domain-containing protein 18-like [Xyrauchen texanus]|uniref:LOW QUALITY PROTEIN: coiled-coil domain-containing protein 18-like n=1 Tax=Xyrauchen texanus TaxID=154827 RepID=UPI0022429E9C|nr:LOW QUALITY PROTEIN: coiled-coil domain-containing protein 18-like [Xyrauchen texanus]